MGRKSGQLVRVIAAAAMVTLAVPVHASGQPDPRACRELTEQLNGPLLDQFNLVEKAFASYRGVEGLEYQIELIDQQLRELKYCEDLSIGEKVGCLLQKAGSFVSLLGPLSRGWQGAEVFFLDCWRGGRGDFLKEVKDKLKRMPPSGGYDNLGEYFEDMFGDDGISFPDWSDFWSDLPRDTIVPTIETYEKWKEVEKLWKAISSENPEWHAIPILLDRLKELSPNNRWVGPLGCVWAIAEFWRETQAIADSGEWDKITDGWFEVDEMLKGLERDMRGLKAKLEAAHRSQQDFFRINREILKLQCRARQACTDPTVRCDDGLDDLFRRDPPPPGPFTPMPNPPGQDPDAGPIRSPRPPSTDWDTDWDELEPSLPNPPSTEPRPSPPQPPERAPAPSPRPDPPDWGFQDDPGPALDPTPEGNDDRRPAPPRVPDEPAYDPWDDDLEDEVYGGDDNPIDRAPREFCWAGEPGCPEPGAPADPAAPGVPERDDTPRPAPPSLPADEPSNDPWDDDLEDEVYGGDDNPIDRAPREFCWAGEPGCPEPGEPSRQQSEPDYDDYDPNAEVEEIERELERDSFEDERRDRVDRGDVFCMAGEPGCPEPGEAPAAVESDDRAFDPGDDDYGEPDDDKIPWFDGDDTDDAQGDPAYDDEDQIDRDIREIEEMLVDPAQYDDADDEVTDDELEAWMAQLDEEEEQYGAADDADSDYPLDDSDDFGDGDSFDADVFDKALDSLDTLNQPANSAMDDWPQDTFDDEAFSRNFNARAEQMLGSMSDTERDIMTQILRDKYDLDQRMLDLQDRDLAMQQALVDLLIAEAQAAAADDESDDSGGVDHCSGGAFQCPNGFPWPECTHQEKHQCPPAEYAGDADGSNNTLCNDPANWSDARCSHVVDKMRGEDP